MTIKKARNKFGQTVTDALPIYIGILDKLFGVKQFMHSFVIKEHINKIANATH